MADHRSEQILAAVKTLLDNTATAGANVVRGKDYDWEESVTDAIELYMGEESFLDPKSSVFGTKIVDLEMIIVLMTKNANPDTRLNLMKKEVIAVLLADHTLGLSWVQIIHEQGFGASDTEEQAEDVTGACEGKFIVRYERDWQNADS